MTTDNQEELFDIVDRNDKVIGQARRREVHRDKTLIHRSVGVVVVNSNNKILLQRRSMTKDVDSLKWTVSCSGHVLSGETYEQTAKRELKEELGVEVLTLNLLSKYLYEVPTETEMTVLYKVNHDGPFTYHPEEILEGKFFTRNELNMAVKTGDIELSLYGKMALGKIGWLDSGQSNVK